MVQSITPQQAQVLIDGGDVEIVDVREPDEWATGVLRGARLVSLRHVKANPKATLTRDGVIFVCAAGVRSETAARLALQNGLTCVYSLTGGTKNWVKAGFGLVRPPEAGALRNPVAPTARVAAAAP